MEQVFLNLALKLSVEVRSGFTFRTKLRFKTTLSL